MRIHNKCHKYPHLDFTCNVLPEIADCKDCSHPRIVNIELKEAIEEWERKHNFLMEENFGGIDGE